MDNCGYIYCMSNPSFKQNIYKIGYTTNLPDIRQKQLNNTSIPELFTLEFAKFVDNAYNEEQIIHKLLAEYRINNNKEFFEVDISIIKTIFNAVEGKYYNDIISIKTFNNEQFFNLSENLSIYDICNYINLLAGNRFIYAYNKSKICLYCFNGSVWRCDNVLLREYISSELSYSVITNRIKKLKDADFKNKLVKTYREVNENLEIKFDFKWYLLGFTNKVYDLQEGIMRDYRYDDYMVSTTGYSWRDPTIDEIQVIKNIIKQIMPIDNERELFLQILCTALDGKNLEKICLFNAPGGNGKSLINDLLIHSLGNYAIVGNNAILFEPSKTTSNPEKSNIHKKRLVVFREPPESKKFENSVLKELSGGGNYSSRTRKILEYFMGAL